MKCQNEGGKHALQSKQLNVNIKFKNDIRNMKKMHVSKQNII